MLAGLAWLAGARLPLVLCWYSVGTLLVLLLVFCWHPVGICISIHMHLVIYIILPKPVDEGAGESLENNSKGDWRTSNVESWESIQGSFPFPCQMNCQQYVEKRLPTSPGLKRARLSIGGDMTAAQRFQIASIT